MLRPVVRPLLLVALLAAATPTALTNGPSEPGRLDDTHAVLSLLFDRPSIGQVLFARQGRPDPYADEVFTLVIDDLTLAPDRLDESEILECLKLPLEIRQEMVADLQAHLGDRVRLDWSRLTFTRRYGRVTEKDVAAWRQTGTPNLRVRTLTWFSFVYFNRDRSVAAARSRMYGPLASETGWQVFVRRVDGVWEARPFKGGCTTIS